MELFCESLFSSSVAFLMSVESQKHRPFNADLIRGNGWKSAGGRPGEWGSFNVGTFFFAKKLFTKTDRCAGALSWRGNQPLLLHFSGRFLLIASVRRRRISVHVALFTVTIPVKCTSEFGEIIEDTT